MLRKSLKWQVPILALLLGMVALMPAYAGSAIVGSVAGSMNATVGGQALLPNTALFSGDSIQVKDGVAVVAMGKGSRMVFGRDTVASFLSGTKDVTVLLSQGVVSMYQPEGLAAMRVKVGDISVLPAAGFKTLGEVAMVNGFVVVTAKEGTLRVENSGKTVEVVKGKTIAFPTKTARAPQGGAAGGSVSGATALGVASLGASGAGAVLSGIALSRAGSAKDAANSAILAANAATTAANAATTAANSAGAAANSAAATAAAGVAGITKICNAISPSYPTITSCP